MTNQENNGIIRSPLRFFSIIPKGQEKRQKDFMLNSNRFINLGLEMDVAKEARKSIRPKILEF